MGRTRTRRAGRRARRVGKCRGDPTLQGQVAPARDPLGRNPGKSRCLRNRYVVVAQEEEAMERPNGHDELLSRIASADPAARLAPMTEGALDRVTRHAMSPVQKSWTWRRFRFASLGALIGSGGLVIAGILGIESAAQNLPILALGPSAAKQGAS